MYNKFSDTASLVSANSNGDIQFPRKKVKIMIFSAIVFMLILLYRIPLLSLPITEELSMNISPQSVDKNKTFNILFWSEFFNHHNWYAEPDGNVRAGTLESVNCPVTNCFFTHDVEFLKSIGDFDAILFHGPEEIQYSPEELERKPNQLYVFVTLEAPTLVLADLKPFKDFFNITMTYRMDSDIPWHYGKIVDRETKQVIAPAKNPNWKTPDENFFDDELMKVYQNKTKSIVWFVSNCYAFSKRQILVKKMQEFIDVDIYGECGPLKCKGAKCDDMLTTTYKFYLSFENSLCKDYVTEKLYRSLHQFSIPVVFNGAENVNSFTPPKSVINANAYDTVEELVNYLKFLMDNPNEYIKYFWYKKPYEVKPHPVFPYTHCELCKKLNDKEFMSQNHQVGDVHNWIWNNQCNQTAHIEF